MSAPLANHPGVTSAMAAEPRAYHCPRCEAEREDYGRNRVWLDVAQAVPLADGRTLVCREHATEAERRNRWCDRCQRVKDCDEFDHVLDARGRPKPLRWRRSCRDCLTPPPRVYECEHCHAPFEPWRSDARFCSGRCRVAAHRTRRSG